MAMSGFTLSIDAWVERQRVIERKQRYEQLNATCPYCDAPVLDELEESAHESGGYGPQGATVFECPHCEREIEFDLRWDTVLSWAMPTVSSNLTSSPARSSNLVAEYPERPVQSKLRRLTKGHLKEKSQDDVDLSTAEVGM